MKTRSLALIAIFMLCVVSVMAQSPKRFNYQAVVRDASNNPYTSQDVGIRFTILNSSLVSVYTETQSLTTNGLGLVNTTIGDGNPTVFDDIEWGSDEYSLKIELDLEDNGSFETDETRSLSSIPYAMHAATADMILGDSVWSNTLVNIYEKNGRIGIGTDIPYARLSVKSNPLASVEGSKIDWLKLSAKTGGNTDNLFVFHRRHTEGVDWNSSEVVIQKQVDSSPMHYLLFKGLSGNSSAMEFGYNTTPYMTIDRFGRVGIGTTTPTRTLEVAGGITIQGNIIMNNDHQIWRNNKALHLRQDDSNSWISNVGDFVGNGAESNGTLVLVGESGVQLRSGLGTGSGTPGLSLTSQGRVGIGTTIPASKVHIEGDASWVDEDPLFQVKNSDGVPVFAVYNNGVRILVEDDPDAKGRPRGGFSVGGFDRAVKGYNQTYDFMRISPDSIRFNINNSAAKGPRGGFAVGGFDRSVKGTINEDFMYITPQSSNDGTYSTFLGYESGKVNLGGYNAFIGYRSGYSNLQGQRNVFVGYRTGESQIWASQNVFIGYQSGVGNVQGNYNVFLGSTAGEDNTKGEQNVYIGNRAGEENLEGSGNVIIGAQAGKRNKGSGNIFIGNWAGYYETGSNRLYIGSKENEDPLIFGYFTDNWVAINGQLRVRDVPSGDYQNLQWNASNGLIYQDNSSRRYKENISLLTEEFSNLLLVSPMTYTRPENPNKWELGYIAEEFEEAGLGKLVWYDDDGRPDGINYEKIVLYSNENIKENRSRVNELEKEITDLKIEIFELKQMVSAMMEKQE